jgi:hypothetical protein
MYSPTVVLLRGIYLPLQLLSQNNNVKFGILITGVLKKFKI